MSYAYPTTPAYRDLNANPANYAAGLAVVIGSYAASLAKGRQYKNPSIDLSLVEPILDRAATVASNIISDNAADHSHAASKDAFLDSRGDALCRTFARAFDLFDGGFFDSVDTHIASEVLERARLKFQWPEAANSKGLALLDMHLRDAVDAIKPLLAKQTAMVLQ